jgi:Cytochrome C'
MSKRSVRGVLLATLLTIPLLAFGCDKKDQAVPPPDPNAMSGSPAGQIMAKIGKGPSSLSVTVERDLKADPTPWDSIQTQASEYENLTAELAKLEPSKGSKDSWTALTTNYAEAAKALNAAAKVKDLSGAQAAQKTLGSSCMGCHREHRGGPGGGPKGKGKGGPAA